MSNPVSLLSPSAAWNRLRRAVLLYGQIFNLGVQSTLTYRWNFLFRSVMSFIPLVGSYYLWSAVFAERSEFTGYNYPLMMAFYISMVLLDMLTWPGDQDFQVAEDVKEGRVSMAMIKPMNFQAYRLSLHVAALCLNFVLAIVPIILVGTLFKHYFHGIPLFKTLLPALVAIAGSALLQFAMSYCIAMLAFWILEISSASIFVFSLEYFAGGHVFPLDILPEPLHRIAMTLPFAYEYFFPVAVLLDRIPSGELMTGYGAMAFWILFFFFLGHAMWERGLKKYTSVGG
jgi:ABC-2 type transport system permease protein